MADIASIVLESLIHLIIKEAKLLSEAKINVDLLEIDLGVALEAEDVINTYMANKIMKQRRKTTAMSKLVSLPPQAKMLHDAGQRLQNMRRKVEEDDVVGFIHDREELCLKFPNFDKMYKMDDEDLRKTLHDYLRGKKYFGVMDDIWDTDAWKEMKDVFPNDLNGSRILITSRRKEVALDASLTIKPHSLQPLNGDDSWKLLCKKVFQEEESILSGTSRKGTCGRL
ncbi:hypothetical protein FEM48_Zijuj04G0177500 [Ziziphus jujuba var. spinosa]|uniref:NB-ARC domain-containing protein n=1 Tax=Ziziphus jujuba var. spinosa TaxID=714518 RepID=A0A978VLA0_ZIZJJ|nr:hypothetical protein FEM48_Zijuj04G0177500 [Ziziphus jujuba var. spinosa]